MGARVVDNPTGVTATGLNLAISVTTGEIIVRCDAQSELPPGYVSRAVRTMERTGADNVGGMQVPVGGSPRQRAIAAAMASPLGAGNARYRLGGEEGPTDTVYLGVFRKQTLLELGGFDESFLRTQDYELNHRIRKAGGVDRKSTRLNSSHDRISYAVFCLKKKIQADAIGAQHAAHLPRHLERHRHVRALAEAHLRRPQLSSIFEPANLVRQQLPLRDGLQRVDQLVLGQLKAADLATELFVLVRVPPRSTLFPYATLFR